MAKKKEADPKQSELSGLPVVLDGRRFWYMVGLSVSLLIMALFFMGIGIAQMPAFSAFLTFFLLVLPSLILGSFMLFETILRHPRRLIFTTAAVQIQFPLRRFTIPHNQIKMIAYEIKQVKNRGKEEDRSPITIHSLPPKVMSQIFCKFATLRSNKAGKLHKESGIAPHNQYRLLQNEIAIPFYRVLPLLLQELPFMLHWELREEEISHTAFGNSSIYPFSHYFSGESQVPVLSISQLCQWLQGCRYISDQEQFGQADYWMHPLEFEGQKAGDCEDHALWAWRKLVGMGINTHLVVGHQINDEGQPIPHSWVTMKKGDELFLLETTSKDRLIWPFAEAAPYYLPCFGVDGEFRTYRCVIQIFPREHDNSQPRPKVGC